jgi:hypothetical protein
VASDYLENTDFRLIRLDPDSVHNIQAGIDGSENVMLALEINSRPPEVEIGTNALEYFRHQRADGSWLMILRLVHNELEQVFGRLCQDLIDEAANVHSQAALIKFFRQRLLLWIKLFQSGNKGCLEKFQIKGLMAELLALQSLLKQFPDRLTDTVMAWTGPLKSDKDFMFSDRAIEVKVIAPAVERVRITSIEQLKPSRIPLQLWIYTLRESAHDEGHSVCLVGLINQLEGILVQTTEGLRTFKERLLEAGYVEQECYESACFNIMNREYYQVTEDFPRLREEDIPEGISDVTYSLELSVMAPFRIQEQDNAA